MHRKRKGLRVCQLHMSCVTLCRADAHARMRMTSCNGLVFWATSVRGRPDLQTAHFSASDSMFHVYLDVLKTRENMNDSRLLSIINSSCPHSYSEPFHCIPFHSITLSSMPVLIPRKALPHARYPLPHSVQASRIDRPARGTRRPT